MGLCSLLGHTEVFAKSPASPALAIQRPFYATHSAFIFFPFFLSELFLIKSQIKVHSSKMQQRLLLARGQFPLLRFHKAATRSWLYALNNASLTWHWVSRSSKFKPCSLTVQAVLALHGHAGLSAPLATAALPAAPQEAPRGSDIYITSTTGCNYNSLPKRKACSQYKYDTLIHTITLSFLPEGHTIFKLSVATTAAWLTIAPTHYTLSISTYKDSSFSLLTHKPTKPRPRSCKLQALSLFLKLFLPPDVDGSHINPATSGNWWLMQLEGWAMLYTLFALNLLWLLLEAAATPVTASVHAHYPVSAWPGSFLLQTALPRSVLLPTAANWI